MIEKLVDFHCHLDLYPDFEDLVRECELKSIYTLAVTTTPRAWSRNHELASRTQHVRAALGIHPQLIATSASEIDLWEQILPATRYVGEVGLDASPAHFRSLDQQKDVFRRVLQACAKSGDKVLSIHSVRAVTPVLDMVERYLPRERSKVVLHWFSGNRAEAQRAVTLGCWFSVNAQMMANERTAKVIGADVPIDRILTETDGPFAQVEGSPARPHDVRRSLDAIGIRFNRSADAMAVQILRNLRGLT